MLDLIAIHDQPAPRRRISVDSSQSCIKRARSHLPGDPYPYSLIADGIGRVFRGLRKHRFFASLGHCRPVRVLGSGLGWPRKKHCPTPNASRNCQWKPIRQSGSVLSPATPFASAAESLRLKRDPHLTRRLIAPPLTIQPLVPLAATPTETSFRKSRRPRL